MCFSINYLFQDSSDECGIKGDNHEMDVFDSPLRTISPECVLPTSLSQSSTNTPGRITPVQHVITPTKYRSKRKQITPQRSPFHNITNVSPRKRQARSPSSDKKWAKNDTKFSEECPGYYI